MRQLIWKDFAVQKRTAYIYLAMGFLFFFYFSALDQHNMTAAMIPVFVIVYSFINRSMLEDERNHAIRMLLTLPLERAVLVKAKYLSVVLVASVTTVLFMGIGAAAGAFSLRDPDERMVNLFIVASMVLCYTVLIAMFIPLVYKLGIARAQTISRFILFGMMALGMSLGALMSALKSRFDFSGDPPAWMDAIGNALEKLNPYAGLAFLFFLSALVLVLSMLMAIRFLDRREAF